MRNSNSEKEILPTRLRCAIYTRKSTELSYDFVLTYAPAPVASSPDSSKFFARLPICTV